uniref:DNA 3'-5' helicase n=1 Tax=Grenadier adomavirus TaxID=2609868 RepID=A0A6F9F3N3_9VIRU|nr:TPA_asm: large T antigen [Grenadier adomavirus]
MPTTGAIPACGRRMPSRVHPPALTTAHVFHRPSEDSDTTGGNTDSDEHPLTQPTPEKRNVPPECPWLLDEFLSQALNTHSCYFFFFLYFTKCKLLVVKEQLPLIGLVKQHIYAQLPGDRDNVVACVQFEQQHRTSRILNSLKRHFTLRTSVVVKVILARGWTGAIHKVRTTCKGQTAEDAERYGPASVPLGCILEDTVTSPSAAQTESATYGQQKEGLFNVRKLNEWAKLHGYVDVLMILGCYDMLAIPITDCSRCQQSNPGDTHYETHQSHYANALIFTGLKDKKRMAMNAANTVLGNLKVTFTSVTCEAFYTTRVLTLLRQLADKDVCNKLYAAALALNYMLGWQLDIFMYSVYKALVQAEVKHRYLLLRGPYNSGKTSVASLIKKVFYGVSLNINDARDSLKFEYGRAIARRMVLFDDVKGIPEDQQSDLRHGSGMDRLDDFRDGLDGHVEIGLEQKHSNKIEQIFPPGIITTNNYIVPTSLRCRLLKQFNFVVRPFIPTFMALTRTSGSMLTEPLVLLLALCLGGESYLYRGVPTLPLARHWPKTAEGLALVTKVTDKYRDHPDILKTNKDHLRLCKRYGPPEPICALPDGPRSWVEGSLEDMACRAWDPSVPPADMAADLDALYDE